jgi:hypothetical protein
VIELGGEMIGGKCCCFYILSRPFVKVLSLSLGGEAVEAAQYQEDVLPPTVSIPVTRLRPHNGAV